MTTPMDKEKEKEERKRGKAVMHFAGRVLRRGGREEVVAVMPTAAVAAAVTAAGATSRPRVTGIAEAVRMIREKAGRESSSAAMRRFLLGSGSGEFSGEFSGRHAR